MNYLGLMQKLTLFPFAVILLMMGHSCSTSISPEEQRALRDSTRTELFADVYTTENISAESFSIDPTKDTFITSANGTIYRLYANSLQDLNGVAVSGKVEIEIKEALTPINFVLSNLTTKASNGDILQSGGMIYINATAGGGQLQLAKGSEIGVLMPNENMDPEMSVYEGEQTDSGIVWSERDPVLNNTVEEVQDEFVTGWYYPSDRDKILTGADAIEFDAWLFDPKRKKDDSITIGTYSAKFSHFTKDIEKMDESGYTVFVQEVVIEKGTNGYISDYNTNYIFAIKKLGWANIDKMYDDERAEEVRFAIDVTNGNEFNYVYTTLVVPEYNIYIPGYQRVNGKYCFTHDDREPSILPIGAEAIILCTGYKDTKPFVALKKITLEADNVMELELKETDMATLRKTLDESL